ncbi:hypothetical protein CEUSTIGMA_g2159.t1 [Chlamydomonas eustigma]|uniref:Uncharacterized protein n=1 Tax=Chlamydomonas eustigma TaxID=1157962 RepID=A0A250WV69_9CHLO|nr:hypothetical protein CEUSTIGMA_g2159.t1 [Chlamydomonas eustigma]|eukprot:GAX74711.1 hypothetical protein CEUSTIGMA_g2159.t1 [Chlamydomonas eustigma]
MVTMTALQSYMTKGDLELVVKTGKELNKQASSINDKLEDGPESKLRCHSTLIRLASPLIDDLLESCSASIPLRGLEGEIEGGDNYCTKELRVDGSEITWRYILTQLYSSFLPPAASSSAQKLSSGECESKADALTDITWSTAEDMLPVLHKYDMQALQHRLLQWIEGQKMSGDPSSSAYVLHWLDVAQTLHLDHLVDICHAQLAALPLSLDPQHDGYVPRWLTQADAWDLPVLQLRCINFLNTGNPEGMDDSGVPQGLPLSIDPDSPTHVLKILQLVYNMGHDKELLPLLERCTSLIRTVASEGVLRSTFRAGQAHSTVASALSAEASSTSHQNVDRVLVHHPLVTELLQGTSSGHEYSVHLNRGSTIRSHIRSLQLSAAARLGMSMSHSQAVDSQAVDSQSMVTSLPLATESEAPIRVANRKPACDAARVEALAALVDGLLRRLSSKEQVLANLVPAQKLYCCSNCGMAAALFKDLRASKGSSWLKVVNSKHTPACPACGNTSCVPVLEPRVCKILWPT